MFPAYTQPTKKKKATITIYYFGIVLEENLGGKITWLSWRHRFPKLSFSIFFPVHTKTQRHLFQFLPVWQAFLESSVLVMGSGACRSCEATADSCGCQAGLTVEIKLRFQIYLSGLAWTGLKLHKKLSCHCL